MVLRHILVVENCAILVSMFTDFFFFISLNSIIDGPHFILPVFTNNKDLPLSPRSTPYDFYRDASSALLQLVNHRLNFIYSRSHVPLLKK